MPIKKTPRARNARRVDLVAANPAQKARWEAAAGEVPLAQWVRARLDEAAARAPSVREPDPRGPLYLRAPEWGDESLAQALSALIYGDPTQATPTEGGRWQIGGQNNLCLVPYPRPSTPTGWFYLSPRHGWDAQRVVALRAFLLAYHRIESTFDAPEWSTP